MYESSARGWEESEGGDESEGRPSKDRGKWLLGGVEAPGNTKLASAVRSSPFEYSDGSDRGNVLISTNSTSLAFPLFNSGSIGSESDSPSTGAATYEVRGGGLLLLVCVLEFLETSLLHSNLMTNQMSSQSRLLDVTGSHKFTRLLHWREVQTALPIQPLC